jgi:predicted metal-binding membrane protein
MPEGRDAIERWLYGSALAGLIGGAWVVLGLLGGSAAAPYFSHRIAEDGAGWPLAARTAVFVAGWLLMSIGMMLPSSLPLVTVFHTMTRHGGLIALLIGGYLSIWGMFGLLAFLGDTGLHRLLDASPQLQSHADLIPPAVLLTAGLFQFSRLKHSCLQQCRSPVGFVIQHWGGGNRARRAFALGTRHGLFCIGCCWALMLLMFGVGGVHLGWMLALGAIMFAEKAVAWGRWVTAPAGGFLTLWAFALLLKIPRVPYPF